MEVSEATAQKVRDELSRLDEMDIIVDGRTVKPSSCYYFGSSPVHILYNLNCPCVLKEQINEIISKHVNPDESNAY